jgi:hypothetical protein
MVWLTEKSGSPGQVVLTMQAVCVLGPLNAVFGGDNKPRPRERA